MSLSNQIAVIQTHLNDAKANVDRLEKDNVKASASKARMSLLKIKNDCHELRKQITDTLKTIPSKRRVRFAPDEPDEDVVVTIEPVKVKKTAKAKRATKKK
jgi:hypothetical protein